MDTNKSSGLIRVQDRLPPKNSLVLVLTGEFQCLGYFVGDGIWRDTFHNDQLHDVIGWKEIAVVTEHSKPPEASQHPEHAKSPAT